VRELTFIIHLIRQTWSETQIIIRADSGFCREDLMVFCEAKGLEIMLGSPRGDRLTSIIAENSNRPL